MLFRMYRDGLQMEMEEFWQYKTTLVIVNTYFKTKDMEDLLVLI